MQSSNGPWFVSRTKRVWPWEDANRHCVCAQKRKREVMLNGCLFPVLAAFNLNCVRSMGLKQQQFVFDSAWTLMLLSHNLDKRSESQFGVLWCFCASIYSVSRQGGWIRRTMQGTNGLFSFWSPALSGDEPLLSGARGAEKHVSCLCGFWNPFLYVPPL